MEPNSPSYTAEISRTNPTCFLFLVDQSSSMLEPFGGNPDKSKADGLADAINRLFQNLILKCAKSEGIRDYFHIGVISYGGKILPGLSGKLSGKPLVPISELADNPIRVEERKRWADDGAGGVFEQTFKFPVWFEPRPTGRTPMCEAIQLAQTYMEIFVAQHPTAYPPMVINITDGMPTDGNPLEAAKELRTLATNDGNVLLFNAHLSEKKLHPIEFPANEDGFPDDFARLLFRMSSVLPPKLLEAALADGHKVKDGSRGFVFNADLVSIIRFLDLGTKVYQGVR